jgi:hypothetical protein
VLLVLMRVQLVLLLVLLFVLLAERMLCGRVAAPARH